MPAKSSDIHETSVLYWFNISKQEDFGLNETQKSFSEFAKKISKNKIEISIKEFTDYYNTYERGQALAAELNNKLKLVGKNLKWIGIEDHKTDSADIEIDEKKISLKDESNIVRNNGFEQLLNTFVKKPLKNFKDPFIEFAPKLSSEL